MKLPKHLYSRLALITCFTLVVGYFVVYATYQAILPAEYAGGQSLSSAFMGKIVGNLNDLNTRTLQLVSTGTTNVPGASYVTIVSGLPKTGYYQVLLLPTYATAWCGYIYPTIGTDSSGLVSVTLYNNASCGGSVGWEIVKLN